MDSISERAAEHAHIRAMDLRMAGLGESQHGLVTARQLRDIGMSRHAVRRRVQRGGLHVVHPRVYALGHRALGREARWMAAVLLGGEGAVLSHVSAAQLLGIWSSKSDGIDIVAPGKRCISVSPGIRFHRFRLHCCDITSWRWIPVTTVPRTLVDLADVCESQRLAAVIREAEYHGLFEIDVMRTTIDRVARGANRKTIEDALAIRGYGGAGVRSKLEERMLKLLVRSGIESPLVNVRITRSKMEVDMVWMRERLCVEVDGPGHLRPAERNSDAERDTLLRDAGYEVLRFTEQHIDERPDEVVAIIRKTLVRRKCELNLT